MVIGTYISITTLNVNGLTTPTKRHRLVKWMGKTKTKTELYAVYKRLTSAFRTHAD